MTVRGPIARSLTTSAGPERWWRRPLGAALVTALLAAVAMLLAACGDDDDTGHMMGGGMGGGGMGGGMMAGAQPAGSLRVDLLNWEVKPERSSVKAGSVSFWAIHTMEHGHGMDEGGASHDLQVMRKKPGGGMELVAQVQGLKMGQAGVLTVTLEPGDYELSCNVVEEVGGKTISHYAKGMHTAFTVTA